MRPENSEYPGYYEPFIGLTKTSDIVKELETEGESIYRFINEIPETKGNYAYAAAKWSIKEVLIHLIDTERIFNYRALCFSRNEKIALPGYDENEFVDNSNAAERSLSSLAEEFYAVRKSTIQLYTNFNDEMMNRHGVANENTLSVRAIAHITCGHALHHINIIKERYL